MPKQSILLVVCGGIAAYKSAELLRLLRKENQDVRVIMTASATQFITPLTFQALSGHPVSTQLFETEDNDAMEHIHLARWAHKIIIAPATANMIAKLAHGLADDLVSSLCLAAECPLYIAPAMNQAMWHKRITQSNIKSLQQQGMILIPPESGTQACGERGWGRMSDPDSICKILVNPPSSALKSILQGVTLLISAGPTYEPLDPVRYLGNRSSGKMGYALACTAFEAGATVHLVSGPVSLTPPIGVNTINVETAEDMLQAVMSKVTDCDIYIGAAAVADYTPTIKYAQKIKKKASELMVSLKRTHDILAMVAALDSPPFVVGFAAETHDLASYAKDKLKQKKLDMIAANWVGQKQGGFEHDHNALDVFWGHEQQTHLPMTDKKQLAQQLMALIEEQWAIKKLKS